MRNMFKTLIHGLTHPPSNLAAYTQSCRKHITSCARILTRSITCIKWEEGMRVAHGAGRVLG